MESSTQKPFACKEDGCGMSFTNEDHLIVHEKKHQMILNLNLGNKTANVFPADQTPTPTRLIKNCEEVGLFEDLKHVNPFEETFRRAVESKSNSEQNTEICLENATSQINLLHAEDSLHTPQVFPNYEEKLADFEIQRQKVILTDNIKSKKELCEESSDNDKNNQKQKIVKKRKLSKIGSIRTNNIKFNSTDNVTQKIELPSSVPLILPSTISLIQPQIITFGVQTATVSPPQRIILPKPITTGSISPQNICQLHEIKDSQRLISKHNLFHKLKDKDSSTEDDKSTNENQKRPPDEEWMERRRAAAKRYRKRIKKEQVDLRQKNADLIAENSELKAIIKHLKQALMAHQNCEISRAASLGTNIQLDDRTSIQIQPTTLKLIMSNIPKLVIQPTEKVPINTINVTNLPK